MVMTNIWTNNECIIKFSRKSKCHFREKERYIYRERKWECVSKYNQFECCLVVYMCVWIQKSLIYRLVQSEKLAIHYAPDCFLYSLIGSLFLISALFNDPSHYLCVCVCILYGWKSLFYQNVSHYMKPKTLNTRHISHISRDRNI